MDWTHFSSRSRPVRGARCFTQRRFSRGKSRHFSKKSWLIIHQPEEDFSAAWPRSAAAAEGCAFSLALLLCFSRTVSFLLLFPVRFFSLPPRGHTFGIRFLSHERERKNWIFERRAHLFLSPSSSLSLFPALAQTLTWIHPFDKTGTEEESHESKARE